MIKEITADPKLESLLNDTFGRDGLEGWKKTLYRETECGAWLELVDPLTIKMGSIVEGVEECAEEITLKYPFKINCVWEALDQIEKDCDRIWMETHGCEDCGDEDETGYRSVNPNCKTCEGQGISI